MGARRKARELTLQVLFQVDVGGIQLEDVIENSWRIKSVSPDVRDFAMRMSEGVKENLSNIDKLIKKYTKNWEISRINNIERNVLRIAIYELLFCADIPYKVTINEAIEVAKKFSTLESGKFINGILDRIAREETDKVDKEKTAVEKQKKG